MTTSQSHYVTRRGNPVPRAEPHNMREWRIFHNDLGKYYIEPVPLVAGSVVIADEVEVCEVDMLGHRDGSWTVLGELLTDGQTFIPHPGGRSGECKKATIRVKRVYDQVVEVPAASLVFRAARQGR